MIPDAPLKEATTKPESARRSDGGGEWYASWQVWAAGLVLLYLATAIAGWGRAVIWDEIWLATNAGRPFDVQLQLIRNDMAHPPLFYLIARGWIGLFGGSDDAIKALPLLINVLAIVAFTILAHRVTKHWRVATLLFCGIYWQVGSVPNLVRAYGLVCLLTILAILAWKNWTDDGRLRWLAAWTAAVTSITLLHYFGVLLVPAFVVANALLGRRPWLFLGAAAVPALVLLPWVIYLLPIWRAGAEVRPESLIWISGSGGLADLVDLAFAFLAYTEPGAAPFRPWNLFDDEATRRLAEFATVSAHLVVVAMLGWWWWRTRGRRAPDDPVAEWMPLLLILFVIPLIGLIMLSQLAPLFHPRFLIGSLAVYWLLFALVADASPRLGRVFTWGIVAWLAVVAFNVSKPSLRPWPVSAAVREVEAGAQPDDVVLADHRIGVYARWEFEKVLHRKRTMHVYRARESGGKPIREERGNNVMSYVDLGDIDLSGVHGVWVLHSRRSAYDLAADHLASLSFVPVGPSPVMPWGPTRFERSRSQQ